MTLSDDEKREMLADGRSAERREAFRSSPAPVAPTTFEAYIAALDDMALLRPHPPRPPVVRYSVVKL